MSQQRKRNPKRETVLHRAQQMMLSLEPPLDDAQMRQVDLELRLMNEENPIRRQWIRFIEESLDSAD